LQSSLTVIGISAFTGSGVIDVTCSARQPQKCLPQMLSHFRQWWDRPLMFF